MRMPHMSDSLASGLRVNAVKTETNRTIGVIPPVHRRLSLNAIFNKEKRHLRKKAGIVQF